MNKMFLLAASLAAVLSISACAKQGGNQPADAEPAAPAPAAEPERAPAPGAPAPAEQPPAAPAPEAPPPPAGE